MTDSAEKLLPCPFCGGKKLHICETNFEATNKPSFTVTCLTVDCAGGIFTLGHGRFESAASARSAWNRRAHLSAHPVTGQGDGWMPIESAPKRRIVLVHYKNQLGNGRTMRACYYPPETLESEIEESGWADEGWYEESEAYEYLMPLEGDPTHWQPLPAPPVTAASVTD